MMERLFLHVGMPKAGSTAIQHFLSCSLGDFEQQHISFDDVSQFVRSQDGAKEVLQSLSDNGLEVNVHSPLVVKTGACVLISSENFSYFNAEHLEGLKASGIAVIREPGGWVTSMATQDLLISIPHNFKDDGKLFALGLVSQEDQLVELIRSYSVKYCEILGNISSWSEAIHDFRLIPYSQSSEMITEISDELAKCGVIISKSTEVIQLRASYDFNLAQIGLSVYLAARFLFKCSRTQSCKLLRLALSIDKLIYKDHLLDVSPSAMEQINRDLKLAYGAYETLMRLNGRHDDVVPLRFPKLQVLNDDYSRSLVDSLISAKLGLSQVPEGFDTERYLSLNPEIVAGVEIEERQESALAHYRRYGYLEARPVPIRKIL